MKRSWLLVALVAVLFLWEPMRVAGELTQALPTLGMRGWPAAAELLAHAAVAAITAAAGWSLWNGAGHGPGLAIIALALSAATSVQSLFWSWLPRQTPPGAHLPFALLAVAHAGAWVGYVLFGVKRSSSPADGGAAIGR